MKMKLFIVEDSPEVRARLRIMLRALDGIEIIGEAEGVSEAIESILRLRPDAVTLDIQIKGGSGVDVLEAIKLHEPRTVVMVLTNHPLPQYRRRCLEAGADFFLDKSSEFEQVKEIIGELRRRLNNRTGVEI
jgi:DNA-binding NarL/FixJ family response regulator